MRSIIDLFKEQVTINGSAVAIVDDDDKATYAELDQRRAVWVQHFIEANYQHGDHVGIQMHGSIEFVAMLLAAAYLGLVVVPVTYDAPRAVSERLFAACDARPLMTLPRPVCASPMTVMASYDINDLFVISTTSGSTGTPKPIMLSQRCKLLRIKQLRELYHIHKDDTILISTPMHHTLGMRLALTAVTMGCRLVILDRYTPERWVYAVSEYGVTFTATVPAQLKAVAAIAKPSDLWSLQLVVSASAPLDAATAIAFNDKLPNGAELHECYGASEIAIATSGRFDTNHGTIGSPAPGVSWQTDTAGQLLVNTPTMFQGYYGGPELASEWFPTGDIVERVAPGALKLVGRMHDIINVGGNKVYPADVEEAVKSLPGVVDCAAFRVSDNELGEVVAVAMVMAPCADHVLNDWFVKHDCAKHLTAYQVPRRIIYVDKIPRTELGKVMRHELTRRFSA